MTTDFLKVKMTLTNISGLRAIVVTASFTCCPILFNQLELCFKTNSSLPPLLSLPCSVSLSVSHDPVVLKTCRKQPLRRDSNEGVK